MRDLRFCKPRFFTVSLIRNRIILRTLGKYKISNNSFRPPPRVSDDPVPVCGIPPVLNACERRGQPLLLSLQKAPGP